MAPEVTSSTTTTSDGKGGGGSGGSDNSVKSDKTADLLQEATQLLKTLRAKENPKLSVMQISNLDRVDGDMALIDSGATHGLRPAHDQQT